MVMELPMKSTFGDGDGETHTSIIQYTLFPPHSTSTKDSFSTDDNSDTEVEAIEMDAKLNLVTDCWVEPQSDTVFTTSENRSYLQGLPYQEIPQAADRWRPLLQTP
ncbi:KICSTOR complex protein SZT2-like [Polyodon spathula]|uniref:KICSTOR complex protein SZT2-like n=1 Tax=Polyodon spathula TaxID=7913 RepID=UPI001B7F1988|nr:KICSTOR complex protein SZT2-like [Polyodon spathula]